jgi:hypothetical protein
MTKRSASVSEKDGKINMPSHRLCQSHSAETWEGSRRFYRAYADGAAATITYRGTGRNWAAEDRFLVQRLSPFDQGFKPSIFFAVSEAISDSTLIATS